MFSHFIPFELMMLFTWNLIVCLAFRGSSSKSSQHNKEENVIYSLFLNSQELGENSTQ